MVGETLLRGIASDRCRHARSLHVALGEDAAADMVNRMQGVEASRSELRELNDLSAARLEARIDSRVESLGSDLRAEIAELRTEMRVGFAGVEGKIDRRFADLMKWSFLFWCGAVAVSLLGR
jgi:hypothetical protein